MKRLTPYHHLMNQFFDWACKAVYRKKTEMWWYPKEKLEHGWTLREVWERTAAAEQLGQEVLLEAKADGLYVVYREKGPEKVPYNVRKVFKD